MGQKTNIQWADSTVNGTSGCDGCELFNPKDPTKATCYAKFLHENRLAHSLPLLYGPKFDEVRLIPGRLAKAAKWPDMRGKPRADKPWLDGLPRMIFVGDMGDMLSRDVPFEFIKTELIDVATSADGQRHIWQVLTKQAKRLVELSDWMKANSIAWPSNIWAGVSITNQGSTARIDSLLRVGDESTIRYLSCEPLLGPVDLCQWLKGGIHQAIIGCESGGKRRRMPLKWALEIAQQCAAAGAVLFVKQLDINGRVEHELEKFPVALRVREMPVISRAAEVNHV